MAAVTDPRVDAPACPHSGCGAQAGDPRCYTRTGFPRHQHAVRKKTDAREKVAGKLAARRPSDAQHRIMQQAMGGGGLYELSGYRFRGDAQRQSAMAAMADVERGWFRFVEERQHGTLYELTEAGRLAYYRYEDWMNGDTRK